MTQKTKNKELMRQIGMKSSKTDSFRISNEPLMNNLFLWSNQEINLNEVIQSFFGAKVRTKLTAILLDIDVNNWIGVAASWQEDNQNGEIRIDSKLTEFLLNNAFGESRVNYPFDIKKLTQVELNILQGFLLKLENQMKEIWEIDSKHPLLIDLIYLVWLVESEEGEIGKIAFALPALLKPRGNDEEDVSEPIDINKLANTGIKVPIGFNVGTTRLSFNEVKSFEEEDLVIFENSDVSKFNWHFGEVGLVLPEEDHPVFFKETESIEEIKTEMTKTARINNDDPLSSLPLELKAEFQKVLIPLKQVLELKSGGVLPLGSVLDSDLVLTAQGKPVAKGELVIVGNQFGMRITEILLATKKAGKGSNVEIDDILGGEENPEEENEGSFQDELDELEEK